MNSCSCRKDNAITWLLCADPLHVSAAMEFLTEMAQKKQESVVEIILQEPDRERYIAVLKQLLNSPDTWLCSAAVNLIGVLVETESMIQELQGLSRGDDDVMSTLGKLLTKDESNIVMGTAGAIASLVNSASGQAWVLRSQDVFSELLENLSGLLENNRESTINSAALILARLSLCELACQKLLSHPSAAKTFRRLVQCLSLSNTDTAMNAAVAVGRLCGSEQGRSLVMAEAKEQKLVQRLQALLCEKMGPEVGQTACFALSCLAAKEDGHALVLESSCFTGVLEGLLDCLQREDSDSVWFAAMTLNAFVSRPTGVCGVREHGLLEEELQTLSLSTSIGADIQEEVSACLRKLKRLSKPGPVAVRCLSSGGYVVSWEKFEPESGLKVTYSLLDEDTVLYCGSQCHNTLPLSMIQSKPSLALRLRLSTCDGDISPCSDTVIIQPGRWSPRPGPPQDLHVIGCTATQVRICWAVPDGGVKIKSYQIYRDNTLLDTTTKLGYIVSGLSPDTSYYLGVCAVGLRNVSGSLAELEVRTAKDQEDHAPSGLTVVVRGRHELHISWGAPAAPLGRLFNYELRLNGAVAYLGTERVYTARWLSANTAYTCTVTAITSSGRCQSRPVTKRTARDEYVHTQRCLYSSSSQLSVHTPTPPTPVRQVNRIREKVKKSPSPRNYLPKVRLTLRHYRDPESNRARLRRPSEPVQSRSPDSPEFLNLTNEKSVGLVTGCDVNALLKSAIDKTDLGVHPANSTGQPLLSYRGKIDLNQQYKVKSQRSPDSTYIRNQINQGTIKLIQPVSYTWTELDWTQHLQNRVLRDRIMTGTKLQSGVRGHHCSATPWTNRSGNTPSTQLLKWTSPMGNPKTLKRDRETT